MISANLVNPPLRGGSPGGCRGSALRGFLPWGVDIQGQGPVGPCAVTAEEGFWAIEHSWLPSMLMAPPGPALTAAHSRLPAGFLLATGWISSLDKKCQQFLLPSPPLQKIIPPLGLEAAALQPNLVAPLLQGEYP